MELREFVEKIQTNIAGADVYARDLTGEGNHYEAFVVSDHFVGKSRIQCQQMVMASFQSELREGSLHALTLKTYTVTEWAKAQGD